MKTSRRSRPLWLTAFVAVLATSVAAAAVAGNVSGTPKNDTLRGTAKADRMYGRGGNDKLYGLAGNDYLNGGAGNDVLVGGPGADTLVCGPGSDTAVADATDKVSSDCEKVTGLPKPALSVSDVSQAEGNGTGTISFAVTLSSATSLPVTVTYATADGSAAAGSDYTSATGQLTFAPHVTLQTIVVPILGDTAVEPDETFTVTLSNPVNARLGKATGTGAITNDDVPKAKPGHFRGGVNNGGSIEFDVSADSSVLANLKFTVVEDCQPEAKLTSSFTVSATIAINSDLSFTANGSGNGFTVSFSGRFSPDGGSATGTFNIHESLDDSGTHYECGTGDVAFYVSQ